MLTAMGPNESQTPSAEATPPDNSIFDCERTAGVGDVRGTPAVSGKCADSSIWGLMANLLEDLRVLDWVSTSCASETSL